MSLRHMLEHATKWFNDPDWVKNRKEEPDPTPVEAYPDYGRPISSLDDLRQMMQQISKEQADAGLESFEEFYDFGTDGDFEDIPAPAQLKHEAVLLARDRDFEAEVLDAKKKYKEQLNAEARQQMLDELQKKKVPPPQPDPDE